MLPRRRVLATLTCAAGAATAVLIALAPAGAALATSPLFLTSAIGAVILIVVAVRRRGGA